MKVLISEVFIDKSQGCRVGETEPYEPRFFNNIGLLFRSLQREYGRCVSKVRVDKPNGGAKVVGWVFERYMGYQDVRPTDLVKFYIQEVWVTLHDAPDTVVRTTHYHELKQ